MDVTGGITRISELVIVHTDWGIGGVAVCALLVFAISGIADDSGSRTALEIIITATLNKRLSTGLKH